MKREQYEQIINSCRDNAQVQDALALLESSLVDKYCRLEFKNKFCDSCVKIFFTEEEFNRWYDKSFKEIETTSIFYY